MTCKLVKHFMFLWQKPSQHCKAIFLQLKNKVKKVWIKQGNVFKSWGSERLHNLSKVALQSPGLGHFTSSVSMLRVLYFLSEINPVAFYLECCMQSSFFGSANKNLVFHFIVSTNSCALCTVMPNRPKYNLEQIKIYFKAMQGDG